MATNATTLPAGATRRQVHIETATRIALVAVAVAVCHTFAWMWLRRATLVSNLWLDSLLGLQLQRISIDTVTWNGAAFQYVVSCTFADVFCGAIPLLWSLRKPLVSNISFLGAFAAALFLYNVARLSVSDYLFALGMNWDLAHNVFSGVSYYFVWLFITSDFVSRWRGSELQLTLAHQ